MAQPPRDTTARTIQAGLLAWILPGAGHYFLGHRGLAAIFFVAISLPYWTGVAVGGVMNSVNPREEKLSKEPGSREKSVLPRGNKWLFLAEMCAGGYTGACYFVSHQMERKAAQWSEPQRVPFMSFYPGADVAQIYLATAGLLNLLAILDAMSRAQYGLPAFHKDLLAKAQPPPGGAA